MISLFINTATKKLVISLIKDNSIIYSYTDNCDTTLSEKIMVELDKAFSTTNLKVNDIDNIFVVNGPGSFTGIRVGITVAKVIAWSLNKEIHTISSLELLSTCGVKGKYYAPLIDARRDYVYAAMYDADLNQIIPDQYILLDDFIKKLSNYDVLLISEDDFNFDTYNSSYDVIKVINNHMNDESINPHAVNPNYLKLTEAEEKYNRDKSN